MRTLGMIITNNVTEFRFTGDCVRCQQTGNNRRFDAATVGPVAVQSPAIVRLSNVMSSGEMR